MSAKLKFLILRFSSIGDIVLTTPVIRLIRHHFPEATIDFATKSAFELCLKHNPYLNQIHLLQPKQNIRDFVQSLSGYDYILDLHHNLRTFQLKQYLKGKKRSFQKLNFAKWLYTQFKINHLPNIHIVDRYVAVLKDLGIKNDNKGLDFFIPTEITEAISIRYPKVPDIAVVLGATYYTKKYPIEQLISLIDQIPFQVLLLGGRSEMKEAQKLEEIFGSKVLNTCGQTNLLESAALLQKMSTVITNDTGMMHIAAALKCYILSIWGNTTPDFGMYPYETEFHIIENKTLTCRPCSKIGFQACPKEHFKCMREILPEQIIPLIRTTQ